MMIWAVLLLVLGACGIAQTGIGVDRPGNGGLDAFGTVSLGLGGLGTLLAYRAVRAAGRATLLPLVVGALTLGPCSAFYLMYNALPPFQVSDSTGVQYAIHRNVPGEVQYTTGYTVRVFAPTFTAGATDATRIWLIPVRFSNERDDGSGHVGRCSLYVDGRYRDPRRERADVRSLGDVDRQTTSYPAGGAYDGRVAFELAVGERDVVMQCWAHARVPAYFDLRPYAVT